MHLFRNKLIALALVLPITLAGQAPPRIVTTSFQVPFTDTVFVSSTSEWVTLSGRSTSSPKSHNQARHAILATMSPSRFIPTWTA
jgi:hypothetical protein